MSDINNHIDKNLEEDIETDWEQGNLSHYEVYDLTIKLRMLAYHKRIFDELFTLASVYCQEKSYTHHSNDE